MIHSLVSATLPLTSLLEARIQQISPILLSESNETHYNLMLDYVIIILVYLFV